MRKSYYVIVVMVALSMLLAACATPTQAPQATEAPVVTEPQTTEAPVVTEAPAVTEAPVVTEAPPEEAAMNPYLGSNKLDGNGVPPTFFDDVHIRKAFAYCFDWDTFTNDVYRGEAVQSKVLALPGMPGFDPNAPFYNFDLDKCAKSDRSHVVL